MNVYLVCGGGLGDILMTYLGNPLSSTEWGEGRPQGALIHNSLWFRRLPDFHVKHPDVGIMVIVGVQRPAPIDLFLLDPNIDSIVAIKLGELPNDYFSSPLYDAVPIYHNYDWEDYLCSEPCVYLTASEEEIVSRICSAGKVIIVHPYSNSEARTSCSEEWYKHTVHVLLDAGYCVVVLGQSWGAHIEQFLMKRHDKLFNLVNLTSARLSIEIVRRSTGFIGTISSMAAAAWSNAIPNVVIAPQLLDNGDSFIEGHMNVVANPCTWGLREPFTDVVVIPEKDAVSSEDIVAKLEAKLNV